MKRNWVKGMNDDGVSEAIGFILIFTIVVLGITIVTLYGYPLLQQSQIGSDERIMEQNMITLQNDLKILTLSNVPYRDTTMGISGGSIFVLDSNRTDADNHYFQVWYNNNTGAWVNETFSLGALRFISSQGQAAISVENGAVVKRYQDAEGSTMVADPRWFYDASEDALVLFFTEIEADDAMSGDGIANIQMSMLDPPEVVADVTGSQTIIIEYFPDNTFDYSTAWKNYLMGSTIVEGGFTPDGDNRYRSPNVSRLVIKKYTVKIERI
ncbi:hypothetical protein AZH53_10885 [Methanomicrobiaceae archaeon CYW5]|uniref:DUF7289 family protein n=1 Tax=Methanovulcanius yangii TaxID=1789227 RepID=UPI0029CA1138|nr:hypothetical protein [Methanovulcanius yangii]MBT8508909.1 hypothetical protein [Methanovulcanius yangii]